MDGREAFLALLVSVLCALAALMILPLVEYVLAACVLAVVFRPLYGRLAVRVSPRVAGLACTGIAVVAGIVPLLLSSIVVLRTAASTLESFDGEQLIAYGRHVARTDLGLGEESIAALEAAARSELEGSISSVAELTLTRTVDLVTLGLDAAVGALVLVFLLYYLLVDGAAFVGWLRDVAPLEADVVDELFAEVHAVTWAVLKSHVFVAILQGILGGLGLAVLGVPYAVTLAVILVFVSFLPTIGVWLVWGPVTIAHGVSSGPVGGVAVLGYGVLVLAVVDNYLRAILVDRRSDLHPATALLGVVGGIYLFGIVGLFVGPVVLASFKACVTVVNDLDRAEPAGRREPSPTDGERERSQLVRK